MQRHLLILFYRQGVTTQYLTLAAIGITVFGLWFAIDHTMLLAWSIWLALLVVVRTIYMRRFLASANSIINLGPWVMWGLIGTTLGGLSWGALGLTYDTGWPIFYQVFLLVLLGGLGGISTASYSSSPRANMLFLSGLLTPIFVRFLLSDFEYANLFVFAIIALVGFLYAAGRNSYKSVMENVELRLSNERLVEDLKQTNSDLNREIEYRNAAEEGLRQERKLFVQGPVMVFRWEASDGWPVLYASPNVSTWGLDAGELVDEGARYIDYVHPADRDTVRKLGFRNPDNRGLDFVEMDYRIVLPDGGTKWVFERTIPARDASGHIRSVDGYVLDITDRKHTEELLFEEKERAQVTLHSIGDGVITTDKPELHHLHEPRRGGNDRH